MTTTVRTGGALAYVTADSLVLTAGGRAPDRRWLASLLAATEWSDVSALVDDHADVAVAHLTGETLHVAAVGGGRVTVTGERETLGVVHDPTRWATASYERAHGVELDRVSSGACVDGVDYVVASGVVPASSIRRSFVVALAGADDLDVVFGSTERRDVEFAAVRDHHVTRWPLLVGSDGRRLLLDRPALIGRNPDAVSDDERTARLVRVVEPAVSRRHALVRVDRWAVTVRDLGSSNGTVLASPERSPVRIEPGRPAALLTGAVIELGGAVSFTLESAA